jgi:medium-chain acyl-[acyl-carrier-protein] hydrolase
MANPTAWINVFERRPEATLRLVCFHFAGGAASAFFPLSRSVPPAVEVLAVQLPGRMNRFKEVPYRRMEDLTPDLAQALLPHLSGRRFAFLGYSLGAYVAFELTRHLRRLGKPTPVHLVLCANGAPHARARASTALTALSDERFIASVKDQYGGIPKEILAEPELLRLLLPVLRADMSMYEAYRYTAGEPLAIGISAYGGRLDPTLTRAELDAWREQTTGPFDARLFDEGHFFLTCRDFLDALNERLEALVAAP